MLVNKVHFHDHTYSYKQSYTHESCKNEISTNKSIDSAHCETLSTMEMLFDLESKTINRKWKKLWIILGT